MEIAHQKQRQADAEWQRQTVKGVFPGVDEITEQKTEIAQGSRKQQAALCRHIYRESFGRLLRSKEERKKQEKRQRKRKSVPEPQDARYADKAAVTVLYGDKEQNPGKVPGCAEKNVIRGQREQQG